MTTKTTSAFEAAMAQANPAQREAIEAIFGPVLVLAGPGTGKTQILSLRIGYILQQTDTAPENILCLTYTEAGATAMRRRLRRLIGSAADGVTISTFHGFCSQLIQRGIAGHRDERIFEPMDDLDRFEVISDMISALPAEHPLKPLRGMRYQFVPHLQDLFDIMTKEAITPEGMAANCQQYIDDLPHKEEFQFKRANKKKGVEAGDPNPRLIEPEIERIEKTAAGAALLPAYQAKKDELGRFDFSDMILRVLEHLRRDHGLVDDLRERYQFILVDEYQDTSGAQNELLYHLCGDPSDQPNVFVVGDDDQSIYRFQGANLDNIVEFNNRFKQGLRHVVLTHNYRCAPKILDGAQALIRHNSERLINFIQGLTKDLVASGANADYTTGLRAEAYTDITEEHLAITKYVRTCIEDGVEPHEIAVLYTQHGVAEPLARYWTHIGLPFSMRRPENLFDERIVRMMIDLLQGIHAAIHDQHQFASEWFKLMLHPWFDIKLEDAAQISVAYDRARRQSTDKNLNWLAHLRQLLAQQDQKYHQHEALGAWLNQMEAWATLATQLPLMTFIDHLLYEGPIGHYIHATNAAYDDITRIYSFFDFIKQRCMRDQDMDLGRLLRRLDDMVDHRMRLPRQRGGGSSQGVQMTTYHSAKGLEYDHVIMLGTTTDKWSGSRRGGRNQFKLPPTSSFARPDDDPQERRRLFYVGLTRARKEVLITSAELSSTGRSVEFSPFIEETLEDQPREGYPYQATEADRLQYLSAQMRPQPSIQDMPRDIIQDIVDQMNFSITAIDKYIACPVTFYYESILRAPQAPSTHLGFGNAVHEALERYFEPKISGDALAAIDTLIEYFRAAMHRFRTHFSETTFAEHLELGTQLLTTYHEKQIDSWQRLTKVDTELRQRATLLGDIPMVGVFDRVDHCDDHIQILDYKTGKASSARKKLAPPRPPAEWTELWDAYQAESNPDKRAEIKTKIYGGSYWRQLVFYRMLAEGDGTLKKPLTRFTMSFVDSGGDDKMYAKDVEITREAIEMLETHIRQVYSDIRALKFSEGCGREHCPWCTLLKHRSESGEIVRRSAPTQPAPPPASKPTPPSRPGKQSSLDFQ